jgi:hypothetical protein
MEPSPATKSEIERRRKSVLRFWVGLGAVSALFVPFVWAVPMADSDRLVLTVLMGAFAGVVVVRGYLQYCRVNLLTLYEKGIAPPVKPHLTWSPAMDFHVSFADFARVEVEDNDLDRKELAEQIYFRFVFHYKDGPVLAMGPSILGRSPSKEQMVAFYGALKEALGNSVPSTVELRKVFPDGRRPVAAVSSRSLRLRVGGDVREFPWERIRKLRIRPAKLGSGASFEKFDLLMEGDWLSLDAGRIPELKKSDLLTFIEEILRIARALKVEILQE